MANHKKEEVKPVLGYQRSENFYQTDHNNYQQFHPAGYAQPCPGYPANPNEAQPLHYYDYNQQPNNNYPARPLPYVSPEVSQGFSFARVMLCLMVFLILFASLMSMVAWSVFSSEWPTIKVESFVVRSFEISNGSLLKANLETKVSVKNTNHRSSIVVLYAENTLLYKYVVLDTTSSVDHLEIAKESTVMLLDAFALPNSKRSFTGDSVLNEMAKDQGRGHILFDLKIDVQVIFKSRVYEKRNKIRVYCEKIKLNFQNGSTIPTWDGSKSECING
ncbi:uncharacterized protein [Nicotiana sylvestris]|uniref:Protein YLS9-like n=2 Tax=Nicotiana TaxID=4085 RepID=A0A1S4AW71_TOBAC|nr:PREDICTED: uncharacterized protein LOC104226528 [Nicotiana sylvestris]XP_016480877.1 PREDICTED: uncharacterized protein LOC107801967 [Nicotiana tabacum]